MRRGRRSLAADRPGCARSPAHEKGCAAGSAQGQPAQFQGAAHALPDNSARACGPARLPTRECGTSDAIRAQARCTQSSHRIVIDTQAHGLAVVQLEHRRCALPPARPGQAAARTQLGRGQGALGAQVRVGRRQAVLQRKARERQARVGRQVRQPQLLAAPEAPARPPRACRGRARLPAPEAPAGPPRALQRARSARGPPHHSLLRSSVFTGTWPGRLVHRQGRQACEHAGGSICPAQLRKAARSLSPQARGS